MFDTARTKVRTGLAHFSFWAAQIGGLCAAVSMVGGWLTGFAEIGPWYMPWIWFAIAFLICAYDWAEGDATPDRRAVLTAMVWPSFLVAAFTGEAGSKLFGSIGSVSSKATGQKWAAEVKSWVNLAGDLENAFTVFSIIFLIFGAVGSYRFAKKKKAANASAGATSPASPAGTRRGGTSR